jgi:hypothetical protein
MTRLRLLNIMPIVSSRKRAEGILVPTWTRAGLLLGSALLVGCASAPTLPRTSASTTPSQQTMTPTVSITPATAAASPTPTPSATPTGVASPLAAVGAPPASAGPYVLGLVNASGKLVASVTANTPSDFGPVSDPPLTSTSDGRLYFEDGNTDIDYLTPIGQHGVAFTIVRPAGAIVAFAVSPDDTRVAVAILNNWDSYSPPYTSHMYLMAMGGGIEQTLFDGSGASTTNPLTWPIGWDGDNLVVAQAFPVNFGGPGPGPDTSPCASYGAVYCAAQLRVFNPGTRAFGPVLCPGGTMSGEPTAAGIACTTSGLQAVSWSGAITAFGSSDPGPCMLSPRGAVIACPSDLINGNTYVPAHLFRAGGVVQPIPNPDNAQIIGWIDGNDVVVTTGLDAQGLAVENIVTGKQIAVSLARGPEYFLYQEDGMIPGAL